MDGWSSPNHWLIILSIVVLFFRAKKIPKLVKGLDKGTKTFEDEMSNEDEAAKDTHKIEKRQSTTNHANTDTSIDEVKKS